MSKLRVIPVMDILNQRVVRALAGRREEYLPLSKPLDVVLTCAELFRNKGWNEIYVANLDAIVHRKRTGDWLNGLLETGFQVWLDAGVRTEKDIENSWSALHTLVLGSETVETPETIRDVVQKFGTEKAAYSLDMKHGRPLVATDGWKDLKPEDLIRNVIDMGIHKLILLDIASVGTLQGSVTLQMVEEVRRYYPKIEIISGGGVRNLDDLKRLEAAGANAALVSTAIHQGEL